MSSPSSTDLGLERGCSASALELNASIHTFVFFRIGSDIQVQFQRHAFGTSKENESVSIPV